MTRTEYFAKKFRRRLLLYMWWLYCAIFPDKIARFVLTDGSRFDYPLRTSIGQGLFIGAFETAEVEFVRRSLKPGDIFLDVGANGGLYTVIAAKLVSPGGHVYAFEPGQRELELLRHNIAINGLENVTVIERAVSNKTGLARFAISRDGAMNSLAQNKHPAQQIIEWQTIQTTTLDDFITEFGLTRVDFIKIDVEGAERFVFQGAPRLLGANNEITLLFETANSNVDGFHYSVQEFLSELINTGLSIYYFTETGALQAVTSHKVTFGNQIYNFVAYTPRLRQE